MGCMAASEPSREILAAALALHWESWAAAGVQRVSRPQESARASSAGSGDLDEIAARIASCEACRLCATRSRTVPGEGSRHARILFVGEAPGADEDASGRPFVGKAGQLLTKIIENGMGLPRGQVFIANVLKCRPPGNRDPEPEEKRACTPFLEEQIEAIRPELIIALGRHAANHLLDRQTSLGRLRGQFHERPNGGPPVLVTYHPAYLLRNPASKRDCWEDIQLAMEQLGIPKPGADSPPGAAAPGPAA